MLTLHHTPTQGQLPYLLTWRRVQVPSLDLLAMKPQRLWSISMLIPPPLSILFSLPLTPPHSPSSPSLPLLPLSTTQLSIIGFGANHTFIAELQGLLVQELTAWEYYCSVQVWGECRQSDGWLSSHYQKRCGAGSCKT